MSHTIAEKVGLREETVCAQTCKATQWGVLFKPKDPCQPSILLQGYLYSNYVESIHSREDLAVSMGPSTGSKGRCKRHLV